MQKTFLKTLAIAACAFAFTACSSDDEPKSIPDPKTFEGEFTTSIPAMPSFTPIECDNSATITWADAEQTSATIDLGAFTIETGMQGRNYEIGAMTITGIECAKASDGSITLSNPAFSCQAGEYLTTGSLEGKYAGDKLSFTITYKPGSMPFDVQSTFTAN